MAAKNLTAFLLIVLLATCFAASDERIADNLDFFKHFHEEQEQHSLAVEKAHEPTEVGRFITEGK
jgi:hypothetical protein